MKNPDILVNAIGILYGLLLVLAAFIDNKLIQSLRIDALFMKQASDDTRPLNLVVGLLVAGYGGYSLFAG
ncbi:MAG: hypothetical protein WC073_07425 [Sterolibacterium sp.]